jgi:hypothetical protein
MLLSTTRLSDSPIWQLQKLAYSRLGVENWTKGRVPFLMTNNSRFAAQVSDIACAAFPKRPFTLLELGGGCGKFAFLCIGELLRRKCRVRYILSDASEKNVAYWKSHPRLKSWIEQGVLETAVLDPLIQDPPPADFIVANYFFDSIPQDLFRADKGILFEGRVSLYADVEKADWDDPNLLPKIRSEISYLLLEGNPYPEFPEAVAVLEEYSRSFEDLSFLLPIGALTAIRRITHSSKDDFLILASDRGPCCAEDLRSASLMPSLHGSAFSLPVNFHAIGKYIEKNKGCVLFSQSKAADFTVALLSKSPIAMDRLEFGPLKTEAADFKGILQRLEEGSWDATLFFSFFDRIEETFARAKEGEKKEMLAGMRQILGRFFPLFKDEALLLERLGQFFSTLGEKKEAEAHFQMAALLKSLPRQGDSPDAFLEAHPPRGDTLQIGGSKRAFKGVGKYKYIGWGKSLEKLGTFDTLLMFPTRVFVEKKPPAFVRKIEEQFSLQEIRYSDADIEAFLSSLSVKTDPAHVLHFLGQLQRKKNITREQYDRFAKRLGGEVLAEDDHFFETLTVCLKHMNPGAVLRAFLPGIFTYDDSKFFERIAVDPYLEIEEISELAGVWLSIKKI